MDIDLANAGSAALAKGALSFSVLQVVSEARNEHGLRHHDFKAYREYCSKKVHRLRRAEHITHADDKHAASQKVKGVKKGKTASGKRKTKQTPASQASAAKAQGANTFTPKVIKAEHISGERPLLLLLFEAERAWAHSQEYRNLSFEKNEDSKLRNLGLNRLRRAVKWADEMLALLRALPTGVADTQLIAETMAYRTILEATRLFDRGADASSAAALKHLSVARRLLTAIANYSPTSRREALAFTFIDQGEAPLRYCAYQLGLSSDGADLDSLVAEQATPEVGQQVCPGYDEVVSHLKSLHEERLKAGGVQKRAVKVEWHGRELSIRNPDLLEAVAKAQAEEEQLAHGSRTAKSGGPSHSAGELKRVKREHVKQTHAERRAKRHAAEAAGRGQDGAAPRRRTRSKVSSGGQLDPYDRALVALGEAEEISQALIAENEDALAKSHTARYEAASNDLRLVHDYIQYHLMSLRIARAEHLVNDLLVRSERQEAGAKAVMERKLASLRGSGAPVTASAGSGSATKPAKRVAVTKKALKPRPRKVRQPKKTVKKAAPKADRQGTRRPARSGTRKLRALERDAQAKQLRNSSLEEARRRIIQSVPGLARLYDGAEASVATIATLGLVESDPEISSLVDAKAAWYRAEMLRTIARAYALSGSYAQALLLLARASLFVRQARQSLSLVSLDAGEDGAATDANEDFPPRISSDVLDAQEEAIQELTRATQREMFLGQHKVIVAGSASAYAASRVKVTGGGGGGVATDVSRLGTALRDLATKYVDFDDAVDLEQATVLPDDVRAALEDELRAILRHERGGDSPERPEADLAAAHPSTDLGEGEEEEDAAAETSTGAYDPANEDEEEEAAAPQQGRSWLGGWFGRR